MLIGHLITTIYSIVDFVATTKAPGIAVTAREATSDGELTNRENAPFIELM